MQWQVLQVRRGMGLRLGVQWRVEVSAHAGAFGDDHDADRRIDRRICVRCSGQHAPPRAL